MGWRPFPRSIRVQLAVLVVATMLPLAALLAREIYAGAQRDAQQAREQVFHLAQVTAAGTAEFISLGRTILAGLAARPAVQALDRTRCDPLLKDYLNLAPRFANALTLDAEGRLVCTAVPLAAGRPDRVDPATELRRTMDTGGFTIGAPARGLVTGRWVVTLAQPLRDAQGHIGGVVALAVDLMHMPVLPSLEGLPQGAVVGILAADGTVVASSRQPESYVGTNSRDRPETRRLLAEKRGTAEEHGLDGILRVRGYVPIPGTDWIAVASLPSREVFAGLRERVALSALLGLAAVAVALLAAAVLAQRIGRPIGALADTARRVAAGELDVRAPVGGATEVAAVARQLNAMLDARRDAEAELCEAERRYRDMLDEVDLVTVMLDVDGRVLYCNDFLLRLTGWQRDEVLGGNWFAVFAPPDPGLEAQSLQMLAGQAPARHFESEIVCKSGARRLVHWNTSILRSPAGAVVGTAGIGQDISEQRRAEQSLRDSEQRLRNLFDQAADGIFHLTADQRFLDANAHGLAMLGYGRDELLSMRLGDVLAPHERRRRDDEVPLIMAGRPHLAEWVYRRKDGSTFSAEVSARALSSTDYLAIVRDLTARRETERALQLGEARLREAQHNAHVGSWHYAPPDAFTGSDEMYELFKLPRDRPVTQREVTAAIHPEDRHARYGGPLVHAIDSGAADFSAEYRVVWPDGQVRFMHSIGRLQRDADGRLVEAAGTVQDITERKLAEQALADSAARLRRILDNMFPFVGLLSLDGRVLEANRAPLEAAGLTRDDVVGRDCAEIVWFSHSADVQARLRAALARAAAGEPVRYDETIAVLGGRLMTIDLMFSPLRDATGRIVEIVGSATDISERRAAERERQAYADELRNLSRRIMDIAETERRAISRELHDRIGQNLATLSINLQLVRARVAGCAAADALARIDDARSMIEATARHARDLMAELNPPALDDFGLLAALRVHAQSFAGRVGVPVEVSGAECQPRLPPRVELALFRIAQEALANVAKHAPAASTVAITLACSPQRVMLTVADDGSGFDPGAAARGATSWGLAIMRERAAAVGAALRIDSVPGHGTHVAVEIAPEAA